MKTNDARDIYYDRSGTASEVARKLAFAGIAIVWLFSGGTPTNVARVQIAHDLRWPAILFTVGLMFDLLQYTVAAGLWGGFTRLKERELGTGSTTEFEAPDWINWPALAFFWVKLAVLVAAYAIVLDFLARRLL